MKKSPPEPPDDGDMFPGEGYAEEGEAYARGSDPETSHEAAGDMKGKRATRLENVAYRALMDHYDNGLTNHELVAVTDLPWNTITPRVRPLVRKGLACDSGNRRKGPAGKYCVVWKGIKHANNKQA
jgi:hypothetical protein